MALRKPAKRSTKRPAHALRSLLRETRFTRIRTEAELAALVRATSARTDRPYAALLHGLIGTDPDIDEALARQLWMASVTHKRELRAALGRDVLLRVAMLDLFSIRAELARVRAPVIISPRLLDRALRAMTTDPLTGLLRREEFAAIVSHELRQRNKLPPIAAYLDINDFKSVNDSKGHAAGDRVLVELGRVMRAHGRKGDAYARLGGDEFAALFVECGVGAAREALERIREGFRGATKGLDVDLAIGLAVARPDDAVGGLLERADAAMYAAKRRGARPVPRARRAGPTVAVAVGPDAEMIHELHKRWGALGVLTIPVRTVDVAKLLVRLFEPAIVAVADSRAAEAWLAQLKTTRPQIRRLRVLAEGAPLPPDGSGEAIARRPLSSPAASRLLRAAAGRSALPIAPLAGPRETRRLQLVIERLIEGRLTDRALAAAGARPELDFVRRHLGA